MRAFELPRAVRGALLRMFTATVDRHERTGSSPVFVAGHLMRDVELALRETGDARAVDELLDALGVDDLDEERLQRRMERALTGMARYDGSRWRYPEAEQVLAGFEAAFAVRWVEPPAEPSTAVEVSSGPPPGAVVVAYGGGEAPAVGGWLKHPSLGVGVVVAVGPTRITVRFADRERVLVRR